MSHTYSEFLPSYSVGVDCYKAIPEIVKPYGKKAVAVGGKTAMEKSKAHSFHRSPQPYCKKNYLRHHPAILFTLTLNHLTSVFNFFC